MLVLLIGVGFFTLAVVLAQTTQFPEILRFRSLSHSLSTKERDEVFDQMKNSANKI